MAELALRDYLNEIDRLIERSSNDEAIQHCRHLLSQHPKCVEAYRLLGKALLEKEEDRAAQDVFERVLSVDPEDFVARVGLSIIHDRNNELDPAVWHMERAFDIAPSNELIQGELRRLYARRDGAAPERIALTRSALARMYTKGDLYDEAIADLRKLLAAQPDRIDLQIQLAEALWRNEQRLDAIEWTQQVTRRLPHCVKANLINGAVLRENGEIAESDALFKRVQAIDPENQYAEELFGPDAPLPRETLMVSRLALRGTEELLEAAEPIAEAEEVPEWLRGITDLGAPPLEEGESYPALAAGTPLPESAPAAEIPAWLQGLSESTAPAAEEQVPNWLAALAGGAAVAAVAGREEEEAETPITPPGEEEVPDWLAALAGGAAAAAVAGREEEEAETPIAPPGEEEVPDWLAALAGGAAAAAVAGREEEEAETPIASPGEEEAPDWLTALAVGAAAAAVAGREEEEAETPIAPPGEEEAIDWLSSLSASAGSIEAAAPVMPSEEAAEETPDWLAQLQEPAPAPFSTTDAMGLEPQEETPDWLRALSASVETDQLAESPAEGSGALAGLAAAGAAAAGAAWWVQTDEEQVEEGQPTESPLLAAAEVESIQVAEPESISFGVASPVAEEAAAPELPEEMPSADDALAFLARLAAGKEDQLRAEAEAEAEARMSEIMGRKAEAKPAAPKVEQPLMGAALAAGVATAGAAAAHEEARKEAPPPVAAKAEVEAPGAEAIMSELPEEMPSADDALAFLARLAAGKEDQLRAEAEAEAEVRMSEIMGRKAEAKPSAPPKPEDEPAPVKMTVAAATVAAVAAGLAAKKDKQEEPQAIEAKAEVEAPTAEAAVPELPEEMPSADDALAFLARLAAGKEDQLRAEAEAEAEARMSEIMGRKAKAKPAEPMVEKSAAGAALAAGAAAVAHQEAEVEAPRAEAVTSELPEEMPSADDALAFLARLAAGKEDQLRAEAEAEAEARMSEIMGRKAEAKPAAPKVEQPLMGAAVETTPESELPDWMRTMRPPEETLSQSAAEEIFATPEGELPDWLHALQPTGESIGEGSLYEGLFTETPAEGEIETTPESELPDWLKPMRPSDNLLTESELLEGEETEWLAAAPTGESLGTGFEDRPAESELLSGLAALFEEEEFAAPAAESISEAPAEELSFAGKQPIEWWTQSAEDEGEESYQLPVSQQAGSLSPDWWVQAAQDEGEEPLSQLPAFQESLLAVATGFEAATASSGKKQTQPLPKTGPLSKTGPLPQKQTGPMGSAEVQSSIESLLSRLHANAEDHDARLELARTYWAIGKREDAFGTYARLAMSYTHAREIVPDLESITEIQDQPDWHRLMGDVYMKAGKLTDALDHYRRALSEL